MWKAFGGCLPLEKVLAVCFPEGTWRRGTGTGGMVVWEGNGGGASSTEGGMWVPNDGLELVMCMLVMCNVSTFTHQHG